MGGSYVHGIELDLRSEKEKRSAMSARSIQQELWHIFTFYSLHHDPTLLEALRMNSFMRFCKDTQILNEENCSKIVIELEVTRLMRWKNAMGSRPTSHVVGGNSVLINFQDFLELLSLLAPKLYGKEDVEQSIKRLLLENVLLLAGRCQSSADEFLVDNEVNEEVK